MNNRQAGRRRGRGGQRQGGNPGRPDNGNRIDNRARGNAAQLLEKYKNLAADAQRQGDRVNTEYYLQFADHYFRVLSESRSRYEEQNQRRQRDDDGEDGDEEFGFEGEPVNAAQQSRQSRDRNDDGDEGRDGGNRRERANGYRRERGDETRDARPAPANDASDGEAAEQAEAPRRRGRPRREAAPVTDTTDDGNGLDIDRLPPSLGAETSTEDAPAERPRRGRPRRARSDDEAIPPAA